MLTTFSAITDAGLSQSFIIGDASNGYEVRRIEGLDPVPANIVSTSYANMDGEQYQSSRREKRNILLTIGLIPDYHTLSVSSLRKNLYSYFMPQRQVKLAFTRDDGIPVEIVGRIESFDAPQFTDDPEATISIICHNPDFIGPSIVVNGNASTNNAWIDIPYDGTVDSGIEVSLTAKAAIPRFKMEMQAFGETVQSFDFEGDMLIDDIVRVVTIPGQKEVIGRRAGVESSWLAKASPFSSWLRLAPGVNKFRITTPSATLSPYTLTFKTRDGGL